jgi:hypothetical protein
MGVYGKTMLKWALKEIKLEIQNGFTSLKKRINGRIL